MVEVGLTPPEVVKMEPSTMRRPLTSRTRDGRVAVPAPIDLGAAQPTINRKRHPMHTRADELMLRIYAAMAQKELTTIAESIREGRTSRVPMGILFTGPMGTGKTGTPKTTLSLQFLLEGVRLGEKVLYVTLSASARDLARVARSHGWDISGVDIYEQSPVTAIDPGKAGAQRWRGIRPTVRGLAMNPVDHPHGGGEAKAGQGNPHPVTPWGVPTKGYKTRKNKRTQQFIVRDRRS